MATETVAPRGGWLNGAPSAQAGRLVVTLARRQRRAKKTTVRTFDSAKLHHQFIMIPFCQMNPTISSGVPALSDVASLASEDLVDAVSDVT